MKEEKVDSPVKIFNLDELDSISPCEIPVEIELKRADGTPTGVFVEVLGDYAHQVESGINGLINARRLQARLNKNVNQENIEDDIDFGRRSVAIRVKSWRNIKDPCTLDNVVTLLKRNPHFAEQINETSKNLGNYLGRS